MVKGRRPKVVDGSIPTLVSFMCQREMDEPVLYEGYDPNDWYEQRIIGCGYTPTKNQKEYANRTKEFLESDNSVFLNPGGMGLGKTIATTIAIEDAKRDSKFAFIACPTAPLKTEWSRELNVASLRATHMVWLAKSGCCVKKRVDSSFDIRRGCNDKNCESRKCLEPNGVPQPPMEYVLDLLTETQPTYATEFYGRYGMEHCVYPVVRYGLQKRRYIIGDYFGFLNPKMFSLVMTRNEIVHKHPRDGVVAIDEAHLLPERAKAFLSRRIDFSKYIKGIKKEICCDYVKYTRNPPIYDAMWQNTITKLELMEAMLLTKLKTIKGGEGRFTFEDFRRLYDTTIVKMSFDFDTFREELYVLAKEGQGYDVENEYEDELSPMCNKFYQFLMFWEKKLKDPVYKSRFQYVLRGGQGKGILFEVECYNTSGFLRGLFEGWNKVILNSGTQIPDEDYYLEQMGLKGNPRFKKARYIESFPIKPHVIRYSHGDFRSGGGIRTKTYNEIAPLLKRILKALPRRTIIFVQSKSDSMLLCGLLKDVGKEIINLCPVEEDGEKDKVIGLINKFNSKKEAIAIMNVLGRVEGNNFKSIVEDDMYKGESVNNIIVLGYPYGGGMKKDDFVDHYTNLGLTRQQATDRFYYADKMGRVHQAMCRAKRKESDNPKIILWGTTYTQKNAEAYMYDDMKGAIIRGVDGLFEFLRKNGCVVS